jgi:uncharacterized protein (DUF608 family)
LTKQNSCFPEPRTLRVFEPPNLLQIAMPMGGIGAGCICLNGYGGLQDFAIRNHPSASALPDGHSESDAGFALLHIQGKQPVTKLIEGPMPPEKLYDQALQAQGYRHGGHEGLPRFESCSFHAGYPLGTVHLSDPDVPLEASVTGWNPFIPLDDVASGIPCAILEYRFQNDSDHTVEFEFSYHLTHLIADTPDSRGRRERAGARNKIIVPSQSNGQTGGINFTMNLPDIDERAGSASLTAIGWEPKVKAMWLRGGWFNGISALWREVSTGKFTENDGKQTPDDPNSRNGGSILAHAALKPGETTMFPIVIAWHMPNAYLSVGRAPEKDCGTNCECGASEAANPSWRPFYTSIWKDACEVSSYVALHYGSLRSRTMDFQKALFSSTIPAEALNAIASNLAILKSPTVLRQENGNVWAWEGCFPESGCCHGSCTHVWNYAQTMPHLFPHLERTLREQELERSIDDRGHVSFRTALPDGPAPHDFHAASDGQLGGIMKLFRDWQISGDRKWLERLYPRAKRSLDYCIALWDPNHRRGLFEPHHNTYDIEFWGPDGMCGSVYVGALSAMAAMAQFLGKDEDQTQYGDLARKAADYMESELFNGEYYQQNVQWEGLRNKSFAEYLSGTDNSESELYKLLKAEGPKYQYGTGCISDGVIGAWMAKIYGIDTPLNPEQIRSSIQAIFRYNHKTDLFDHACTQRPGYAMGHEPGLLLCTWPHGGKPTLPFVYSDEVWTGIEYQAASHLIEEGFVDEGLTVIRSTRSRYDGHVRNPFNEYECGSYYARAMASYALLSSLSGFRYSAVDNTLWFGPKVKANPFQCFFSTASGYGVAHLSYTDLTITIIERELMVNRIILNYNNLTHDISTQCTAHAGEALHIKMQ